MYKQNKSLLSLSLLGHTLIKVLRHNKDKKIIFDVEGYTNLTNLLTYLGYKDIMIDDIKVIIDNCQKQRFSLKQSINETELENDNSWYIRANQGHSFSINPNSIFTSITEPEQYQGCFHGTNSKSLEAIQNSGGLSIMNRTHIHIAISKDAKSGHRKSCNVFIYIDIVKAVNDGIKFYLSSNGVILTKGVEDTGLLPSTYFSTIESL